MPLQPPGVGHTQSTKAQPCLRRGVSLWLWCWGVDGDGGLLTVAGLMVITLPGGPPPALWTPQTQNFPSSPTSLPLPRCARGPKHTLCWPPHFFWGGEKAVQSIQHACCRHPWGGRPALSRQRPSAGKGPPRQRHACQRTFFIPLNAGDHGWEINHICNTIRFDKMRFSHCRGSNWTEYWPCDLQATQSKAKEVVRKIHAATKWMDKTTHSEKSIPCFAAAGHSSVKQCEEKF